MDLNARVDVNCGRKDGRTDGRTEGRTDGRMDGPKTGRLYRTLLKQVRFLRFMGAEVKRKSHLNGL